MSDEHDEEVEHGSNTVDPAVLKEHIHKIEEALEKKLSHKMQYVESCKPYNEAISNAYEVAGKVCDVPTKVLKAKIKERELYAKIAAIPEDLHEDAQDSFAMISEALGEFGDLPLGQAAKDRAAGKASKPEEPPKSEAPKKAGKGGGRKAPSAAAAKEDFSEAGEESQAFQDGYKRRMADKSDKPSAPPPPKDLKGDDRDRWHNGWLKADADDKASARNAELLKGGIKGMPGASAEGKATLQ